MQDLGIYFTQDTDGIFRYHLNKIIGPLANTWSYYHDCDLFIQSEHSRRVAFLQAPYPFSDIVIDDLNRIYDYADAIIIFGTELHPKTLEFIRQNDKQKIHWFLCGDVTASLTDSPLQVSRSYHFLDWFITSVHFYKNVKPSLLYQLRPHDAKPYMFDALLGRKKPHRTHAHEFLHNHNIASQGIVTYVNDYSLENIAGDDNKWLWESEGLEGHENALWTVDRVKYFGHKMSLSQVVPLSVYNQSAYSLVCETNFDPGYIFFTEKTVKPILGRRLFIMLSHQYSLAKLREFGFRTFHGIIDESYDEEERAVYRHEAAMEQLKWLCQQDQTKILAKCHDIVNHNYDLMCGTDWYQKIVDPITNILLNR